MDVDLLLNAVNIVFHIMKLGFNIFDLVLVLPKNVRVQRGFV